MGKGDGKRIKELENEVETLKMELNQGTNNVKSSTALRQDRPDVDVRNIKKDLTSDEQIQIQKELAQMDKILKGYMDENSKAVARTRELE